MENEKQVSLPAEDADSDSLSQLFPDTEDFTVDDLAFQPQFQSTPKPPIELRRKRHRAVSDVEIGSEVDDVHDEDNTPELWGKCYFTRPFGIILVPLFSFSMLLKCMIACNFCYNV